jgi:hypothetical protein
MKLRSKTTLGLVLVAVLAVPALVVLGRITADPAPARRTAVDQSDEYFDGLQVGEAQGRREGRALQEGAALPAGTRRPVHDAFDAGYAAGANDVFAGYDGGWAIGVPYVVTMALASGHIVYRIKAREPFKPNVNYYLCPNGKSLCQEARH